jgi:hypothetical protein
VSTVTAAEPGPPHTLRLSEHLWSDREFDLKFTDDGRMSSASNTSTGIGAKVIEAGVKTAVLAARVLPMIAKVIEDEPANAPKVSMIDAALASDKPDLAAARDAARERVDRVERSLGGAIDALAGDRPPQNPAERVTALEAALAAARRELALLETQVAAWRAIRFPVWTQSLVYDVGTDDLPELPELAERLHRADLRLDGDAAEAAHRLGVVVVRVADSRNVPISDELDDGEYDAFLYREPRLVSLAIYEAEPVADRASATKDSEAFRLRRLTSAWVVDSYSEQGVIRYRSDAFAKRAATAAFGEAGTLTGFSNSNTSALGAVAGAVASVGGQITESLDAAAKITAALPADPQLGALQAQVDEAELKARLATANHTISKQGAGD